MSNMLKTFFTIVLSIILLVISFFALYGAYLYFYRSIYPMKYESIVKENSNKYNVKQELIYSTIFVESHFDKSAVSEAGAIGLMQITPDTFDWLTKKNPLDSKVQTTKRDLLFLPEVNIEYGTYFISMLLDKYEDRKTAMCAYNAGTNAVDKWLNNKEFSDDQKTLKKAPYKQTEDYADKILHMEDVYRQLYFNDNKCSDIFYALFPAV